MKIIKRLIIYIFVLIIEVMIFFYLSKDSYSNLKEPLLISISFICLINIALGIFIFPIVLWKTIANKSVKYEKLSKEDFMKNNHLYRDILSNISPAVLTYIDTMDFNYEAILTSILLFLKSKDFITFENSKIVKTEKLHTSNLGNIENYVLNNISDGKLSITKEEINKHIINEACEKKLVKKNNNAESKLVKIILLSIGILIFLLIFSFINMIIIPNFLGFLGIFGVATYPIALITFLSTYIPKYVKNPTFRTKEGKELNIKLEGLKRYINEYSLLNDKTDSSIEIWADFLIYSVIFKQNNKISQEYSKYFVIE